jgi:hypothetical protein
MTRPRALRFAASAFFSGATSVVMNGTHTSINVVSNTFMTVTVPEGATTGYVTVTAGVGDVKGSVPFFVIP